MTRLSVTFLPPFFHTHIFQISSHSSVKLLLGNTVCDVLFAPPCEKLVDSPQRHNKRNRLRFLLQQEKKT